jgi:hypothetical protein
MKHNAEAEAAERELDGCISRASALALMLSDEGCAKSIASFSDGKEISACLHWLLSEELFRARAAMNWNGKGSAPA